MDTCIAIRTMTIKDGVAYLQAGGGIVFDSVEEDEYVETLNKLSANMRTIDMAEGKFSPYILFIYLNENTPRIPLQSPTAHWRTEGLKRHDGTCSVQGVVKVPNVKAKIQSNNYDLHILLRV